MAGCVNICALLVGLAAFAGWTLSRSIVPRRMAFYWLGGVGILALFFSIVSPDDDAFQQELIRPATPSVRVSAHTRVVSRRSLADLSIPNAFSAAGNSILAFRTGRLFIMDQPFDGLTHFQAPISIHSPPVAS
jgi:hypothetical protein